MMKKLLFILLFPAIVWANTIEQPPVDQNLSVETGQYLQRIYDNMNKVNITATDPNGNIRGDIGELRVFNDSGSMYMKICTSSPAGTTWVNSTTIPAVSDELVAGMIIMWAGTIANIPTGWHLCDGTEGTPDLRDRFIICADSDSGGTYDVNDTGDGSIPEHSHSILHDHTMAQSTYQAGTGSTQVSTKTQESSSTILKTSGASTASSGNYGTGTAVIAKYYALAYIMKL